MFWFLIYSTEKFERLSEGFPDESLRFVNERTENGDEFVFNYDGIFKRTNIENIKISDWTDIYKIHNVKKYFYFFIDEQYMMIVPKKSFESQTDLQYLEELIKKASNQVQ